MDYPASTTSSNVKGLSGQSQAVKIKGQRKMPKGKPLTSLHGKTK